MSKFVLFLSAILVFISVAVMPVYAYDPIGICNQDKLANVQNSALCQGKGDSSQNPLTGQTGLIRRIANILAIVAGVGAVITIIVAGFRYITSGGDAAKVKGAKDAIIAALIGVVIIALADAIIGFVISRV